ncbi:hypothetical protein BG011_003801 [Mortierella polycephala]|uniref:Serine aminopeptidase S33 domain-containing protein n=1 Tax=Mortierella polycephala TaxID=41804 RepID=A0A9P6U384_9FUNG|nr:hypothetical protein BG011_003801 [Mortierella polycephala]
MATRPSPKLGYDNVFEEFNKAGFQASAYDQRGFGETGKKAKTLGSGCDYEKAIPDIPAALERGRIEGFPLFLMGHSFVSLINGSLPSTLASAPSTDVDSVKTDVPVL